MGSLFTATLRSRRAATATARGWVGVWLSKSPKRTPTARLVGSQRLGGAAGDSLRTRLRLRVPRGVKAGDYHVIACLDTSQREPSGSRCLTSRNQLHVLARERGR